MPAINLAFGTRSLLRDVFGTDMPKFQVTMAGGVLNVHPTNTVGNLWQFDPMTNQYHAIPQGDTLRFVLAPQSNLRYLPWQQDHCTGMELDGAARVFVTGPLNGCSFLMARDGHSGRAVVLHANSNQNRGNPAARNSMQLQYAVRYLNVFHNGASVQFETQYERDMHGKQGWIIGADVHGDGRSWQILCAINEKLKGFRPNYFIDLGVCTL